MKICITNEKLTNEQTKDIYNIPGYEKYLKLPRIDILSVLALEPTELKLDGYCLSGVEFDELRKYFWGKEEYFVMVNSCIDYDDQTFYKEEVKTKETIKMNRFELMEI